MQFSGTPYRTKAIRTIDSPVLFAYPDIIDKNIDNALHLIEGDNTVLRPHVKTVKCREVIDMALLKNITKFKCSTIAEAELLGSASAKDILLCYQLSEIKAKRFEKLRKTFPDSVFSSLIDSLEMAKKLSDIFKADPMDVFVDINVGMDRTGILPQKALRLVQDCNGLSGLRIVGIHAYDGHVHSPDPKEREDLANRIFGQMAKLRSSIEEFFGKRIKMVLGGSPSFRYYAKMNAVECSPGTIFFWDSGYAGSYPELPFTPAVVIVTRIVSIVSETRLCLDLGSKAVAADPPQPRLQILDLEDYDIVSQYEEHLVVEVSDTKQYQVGQPFFAIPHHICPTVNLYETLEIIQNGRHSGQWSVPARNRKITI